MKLFYDGTLGAQTALVSQDYLCPHKGAGFSRGQRAWSAEAFQLAVRRIWQSGLEVSVHVLGDQAADEVVSLIRETMAQTQDGPVFGKLSLEHVELLRPETIQKMKSMHVSCYMQPSHAVSDSQWLPDLIGTNMQYAFRWESLLAAGIPVYWGSDSPIMQPSIELTLQGLLQQTTWKGKNKQSKLLELLRRGHTHPDASFRAPEI
jgi:predicted amidohydrolase YtcJ